VAGFAAGADDYLKYTIPKEAKAAEGPVRPGQVFSKAIVYSLGDQLVGRRAYYENGTLYREIAYKNGEKHGIERVWFKNGRLEFESPYKEGIMHGTFRQWDHKGKLLGSYNMKMGTGVKKKWHENGQLEEERPYKSGKLDGFYKAFFDNGRPRQTLHFKSGEAHGVSRIWDANGKLIENSPLFYIKGKRVSKEEYEKACQKDPSLPIES
jgi:antitoxin component YwqK of YwqJK toxin-antitoxin module